MGTTRRAVANGNRFLKKRNKALATFMRVCKGAITSQQPTMRNWVQIYVLLCTKFLSKQSKARIIKKKCRSLLAVTWLKSRTNFSNKIRRKGV